MYLSIPGIEIPRTITIKAITSDYPPKLISVSTNGDKFVKHPPTSIGQVATEVRFKLNDVTSRYMNSWIYLVFYVENDHDIKPYMIREATVRVKKWIRISEIERENRYSNQDFKSCMEEMKNG